MARCCTVAAYSFGSVLLVGLAAGAASRPAGDFSDWTGRTSARHAPPTTPTPAPHPGLAALFGANPDRPLKVWVYFTDKGYATPDAEAGAAMDLERTYDARATQRRRLRRTDPGLFDPRDLPVAPAYIAAVAATGARTHVQSRWLNAASFYATREQAERIAAVSFVRSVEPVRAGRRFEPNPPDDAPEVGVRREWAVRGPPPPIEGLAYEQQAQIGVTGLHNLGFTGQGVIIGILDTGFSRTHDCFHFPGHSLTVVAEHDFVFNDGQTANEAADDPNQHNHGTYILSTIGAYLPGTYCGGAYDASFVLCKTEDIRSETPIEEDNFVAGLEFIEMHGADMATASLGYIDWYTQSQLNGTTAVTSIAVNTATANGLICCNAAGNGGNDADPATSHLIAPADALLVISVGAVDSAGGSASFTSDGPSADGRVKPEVMARGVSTLAARVSSNTEYAMVSGTSLSTPLIAGALGCLIQAHPTWTVSRMRSDLFSTGDYFLAHGTFDPLFIRGYGVINAAAGFPDCNGNGVRDDLDIAAGSSDCNHNGVPDECETNPCPPNFDGVNCLTVSDIFAYLAAWFAGDPRADFNHVGATNIQDIFDFLAAWFAGCP